MVGYSNRTGFSYKSAGERTVAEGLRQLGVPFAYEYPWAVLVQGKPRIFYPDFTLKDYGVVIEYVGRRGDPDYDRIMARKRRLYREAAVPVIELQPEDLGEGWPATLLGRLEEISHERSAQLDYAVRRCMASPNPDKRVSSPGSYQPR
jgi:hypothetical protein